MKFRFLKINLAVITILLCSNIAFGQTGNVKTDSSKVKKSTQDSSVVKEADNEIELMEINIEAEVEKPRVAIMPKRVDPKLGEMEFVNRTFENELKKLPDKPMITDDRLLKPRKIENLKKKIEEKKEKTK